MLGGVFELKLKLLVAPVAVMLLALAIFLPFPRRMILCYAINPYHVASNYTVSIPPGGQKKFATELDQFLRDNDLMVSSGQMLIGEVGAVSNRYLDFQSLGCDGAVFVWSGNDLHPNEFNISFHRSSLFGPSRAVNLSNAFLKKFGSRYQIATAQNWQNVHSGARP